MIGPEHYRAAEKLLRYVGSDSTGEGCGGKRDSNLIAAAQAHATLALAAATVTSGYTKMHTRDLHSWRAVAFAPDPQATK